MFVVPGISFSSKLAARAVVFLSTKSESLDYRTIAVDVAFVQIVKQSAAFSYQDGQRPCGSMIFTVLFEVLRQMGNTV